jgi:hypothetical protein
VRRSGHTNAAIGYGPGDHVCWVFEGPAAWLDVVVPYLREGAECRDRLVYVGDKAEGALIEDLAGLPGRDALLASGQLQVMPLALAYQGHTTGFDVGRQVATFHEQALAAVADGYRSLRLATDVSTLAETEQAARGFTAYELLVDAMASCTPWTSLCGYDRDRVGPDAARALCFVHPAHHGEDVRGTFHAGGAGRWCLGGEVDLATREALRVALAALPVVAPVHLDVSALDHLDVAGLRALTALAAVLAPAGGLVLHHPPSVVTWMLGAVGDVPGMQVVGR